MTGRKRPNICAGLCAWTVHLANLWATSEKLERQSFIMEKRIDFSCLADAWPSPIVARSEVAKFSGGLLHPATMANHDSVGTGPKKRFKHGKKVGYWAEELIAWMEERSVPCDDEPREAA